MTAAGGEGPPAGTGGHAWDRLREQRARDLGEDPGPDPAVGGSDAEDPEDADDPEDPDDQRLDDQPGASAADTDE